VEGGGTGPVGEPGVHGRELAAAKPEGVSVTAFHSAWGGRFRSRVAALALLCGPAEPAPRRPGAGRVRRMSFMAKYSWGPGASWWRRGMGCSEGASHPRFGAREPRSVRPCHRWCDAGRILIKAWVGAMQFG
jgi:hypothetical protein